MSVPVPKPRTKIGINAALPTNGTTENVLEHSEFPSNPSVQMLKERSTTILENIENGSIGTGRPLPPTPAGPPPRPPPSSAKPSVPMKPPRGIQTVNEETKQHFGNVIGELNVNFGEASRNPSETVAHSPPRQIPPVPPPPVPPAAGWKPEVLQAHYQPLVPERTTSNQRQYQEPSTSTQIVIENPIYLGLREFRSMSGMSSVVPVPDNHYSDDCDPVREWLSEEEENEIFNRSNGTLNNEPSSSSSPESTPSTSRQLSRHVGVEDNPYTPCPRRSDYSETEAVRRSSAGSKNQNIYMSHQELMAEKRESEYSGVVEACTPGTSNGSSQHCYVNVPTQAISKPKPALSNYEELSDMDFSNDGKPKIDGSTVTFVGFVMYINGKKHKRMHARLRDLQLGFYDDEEDEVCQHGPYYVRDFTMFRKMTKENDVAATPSTASVANTVVIHVGEKKQVVQFQPEEPASLWIFFISEAWISHYHDLTATLRDAQDLSICGNIWIRQGTTGEWTKAAAGINGMTLAYVLTERNDRVRRRMEVLTEVDLRKIMKVSEKTDKTHWCPSVKHKRGPFLITLSGLAFYIDSKDESTTNHWLETIQEILSKKPTVLNGHRLTSDNIPFFVDKCLRYVEAYGLKSEGLYRKNGRSTELKEIMKELSADPVGYHIIEVDNLTVFAVADILRQFFRKLDEPLVSEDVQKKMFEIANEDSNQELYEKLGKIVATLPIVHYSTLKKVVAHLKNVSEHAEENLATVENLAKVFGSSLFMVDSSEESMTVNHAERCNSMVNLIKGYDTVFHISNDEEISRQMVKEAENKKLQNPSGAGFIVAIHMFEKEYTPFNVKDDLASEEVCREAVVKKSFNAPSDAPFAVFEVLCGGELLRRLPASEKMRVSVLRWLDWGCADGYMLFDVDKHHYAGEDMSNFTSKVKMAEPGSKTFKSYELMIKNGVTITAYRNDKLYKVWSIDDVVYFVGGEACRKSPNHYNCTMICSHKEGYNNGRLPGYCLSFKDERERTRWLNAVNHAQTGGAPESLVFI